MENTNLSDRHQRLLSSLLFVLEQKTESIEHMLLHPEENATYHIEQDLQESEKKRMLESCSDLKASLKDVGNQLGLKKRAISQRQYISTIQSQMWENISDAFSSKMKGYGKTLVGSAKQTDPLIEMLADKIDQIRT